MNKSNKENLRIFCLCGQKMQVTPAMYGRPANCIACKQKMFIPEAHEIDEDTKVIYLKDRLELLRKPGVYEREEISEESPDPGEVKHSSSGSSLVSFLKESALESGVEDITSDADLFFRETFVQSSHSESQFVIDSDLPLDPYHPIQLWAGFSEALVHARANNESWEQAAVYDQIEEDLEEVHDLIKERLSEEIHTAEQELKSIDEESAHFLKSLNRAEISLSYFKMQTERLRGSREIFARRLYSLQRWADSPTVSIIYPAHKVLLDDFEKETFPLNQDFALWPQPSLPLSHYYFSLLKTAFEEKAHLQNQVESEKQILAGEEILSTEAASSLSQIHCQIHFLRQRLQQLMEDTDQDIQAMVHCQVEVLSQSYKNKSEWRKLLDTAQELENECNHLIVAKEDLEEHYTAHSIATLKEVAELPRETTKHSAFPVVQILALSLASFVFLGYFFLLLASDQEIPFLPAVLPSLILLVHIILSWPFKAVRNPFSLFLFWSAELAIILVSLFYLKQFGFLKLPEESAFSPLPYLLFLTGISLVNGGNASELVGTVHSPYKHSWPFRILVFLLIALLSALVLFQIPSLLPFQDSDRSLNTQEALIFDEEYSHNEIVAPQPRGYSDPVDDDFLMHEEVLDELEGDQDVDHEGLLFSEEEHAQFYLSGVVHAPGKEPRFRGVLKMPNGTEETLTLFLGEVILDDWVASEYNPSGKRLIISNGKSMLVLQAGKTVPLVLENDDDL